MSAFAPYRKVDRSSEDGPADLSLSARRPEAYPPGLVRFPLDLTTVLFGWPLYGRGAAVFGLCDVRNSRDEDPEQKKEKFYIKNLLKSDAAPEKQRSDNGKRKFEEEASKMEAIVSNLGKSVDGHRCIYCGKVYSRKYGLKIHIRTHTGYKPLKCKYCLRPFGDPSNLNKHVRLHARGQTPYNCQFCGKILVRRRDLERHIKSKHGEPT